MNSSASTAASPGASPPQLPHEPASARAVRAAELSDSGDARRASRAAAAVGQLDDGIIHGMARLSHSAKALLEGENGAVSLPIAQSLAARATTHVLQTAIQNDSRTRKKEEKVAYKPYGDDWRACVQPWVATAGEYHTPCLARDIPEAPLTIAAAAAAKARGETPHLTQLCPRGLYLLHLTVCERCVAAEKAGAPDASCEIHALVALARGVWVIPDPDAPPRKARPAKRPPPPDEPLSEADRDFMKQQSAVLEALGITRTLSPEEEADPARCGPIARQHVVWRNRMALPPEVAEIANKSVGELDVQRLAQHAQSFAAADAAALLERYAAAPNSKAAREAAFEEVTLQRMDTAKRKGRVVTGLHKTANKGALALSIDYSTAAHLMTACGPRAVAWVHDGEKAYNQVPIHASAQRLFAIHDPVDDVVRVYTRCPFGGNQTCTLFSGITALMKEVLRTLLVSLGGGPVGKALEVIAPIDPRAKQLVEAARACALGNAQHSAAGREVGPVAVGGILDDIAIVVNPHDDAEAARSDAIVRAVFTLANFLTNGKEQFGKDGVIEVLGTRADLRRRTLTPKGVKLFETLYQLSLLQSLMQRAGVEGAPPISVPLNFLESVSGSLEWSGPTFDWRLRVHRQGAYAAVAYARKKNFYEARLSGGDGKLSALARMLHGDVEFVLRHALEAHWRPMQFFPARDLSVVRVFCARCPTAPLPEGEAAVQALVERAFLPSSGQEVVGVVSDASIDADAWGSSVWALHVPAFAASADAGGSAGAGTATAPVAGAGASANPAPAAGGEILYRAVPRGTDDSSGTIELEPWVALLERHGAALRGKFLVMTGDNLGNMYRVNRGRVRRGTRAHVLLTRLYDLAAQHDINFIALWLPRAANQYLDAISKCRTVEEAQRTVGAGLRVVQA